MIPLFFVGFKWFFSSDNDDWVKEYAVAKKGKDCRTLHSLSQNSRFSLRNIARIEIYKNCPDIPDPNFHWDQFPSWLQKRALEAWYHRASSLNQEDHFITASRILSEKSQDYNQKVRYLTQAVRVAKHSGSSKLDELLKKLYTLSPSRDPHSKDFLKVAYDLKKRTLYTRSIRAFRKVLNSKTATVREKDQCFENLIWLYKKIKSSRHMLAVKQYSKFLDRYRHEDRVVGKNYFRNQVNVAQNYWNAHQTEKAMSVLRNLQKDKNFRSPKVRVHWMIGKIFEEQEDYNRALWHFNKGRSYLKSKDSEFNQKLAWAIIWNLRKLKKYDEALKKINEFEKELSEFSPKFTFWKAHMLEETGRDFQARNNYRYLINISPFDFHGIIAHYKIDHPISLKMIHRENLIPKRDSYQIIEDFMEAGEEQVALSFIQDQLDRIKDQIFDQDQFFNLFYYSAQAGYYLPLFQFIGSMPPQRKSQLMEKYANVLFPKVYQNEVQEANKLFGTSSEIIYSIMRQESAFDRRATSPSRAMGLMQVLPRLARSVSKKEGISFRGYSDLYHPKTNILIGSAHLKDLFKSYGSYLILNAAIYNAGQEPVKKWVRTYSMANPIEFIENIPYSETRIYIQLIIRNLIFYKLLNESSNQIKFPEWILNLPKNSEIVLK